MPFDVFLSWIAERVEAFPVAQFSCRVLAMPERWMCDILAQSVWGGLFSRRRIDPAWARYAWSNDLCSEFVPEGQLAHLIGGWVHLGPPGQFLMVHLCSVVVCPSV